MRSALRYLLRYIPWAGIPFSADLTGQKVFDLRVLWSLTMVGLTMVGLTMVGLTGFECK